MEVKSEIYEETNFSSVVMESGNVISKFRFNLPTSDNREHKVEHDEDSDLIVVRKKNECIEIEHKRSTTLSEVGLQVWRGAFLLNDYILSNRSLFSNKIILELGSGVGLTSILAGIYARKVICTDINIGGILDLIQRNINLNKHYQKYKNNVQVHELNFMAKSWSVNLEKECSNVDICVCADVIYDDDITEAFIDTILKLFKMSSKLAELYIALEKRYVFIESCCAPMYEHFLKVFNEAIGSTLKYSEVSIDFPQYFEYERCKELVLLKVVRC